MAWETNEKNLETNERKWETNERKWETRRPGTRPDHPAPRRPFFKALRTPNSKLFGEIFTKESIGRITITQIKVCCELIEDKMRDFSLEIWNFYVVLFLLQGLAARYVAVAEIGYMVLLLCAFGCLGI